jgi:hypothetical protein
MLFGVLTALSLLVPPAALLWTERDLHELRGAVKATKGTIVHLSNPRDANPSELHGQVVHFIATGEDVQGSTGDRSFGVRVPGGLRLRRRTEYCQWSQAHTLSCEQCEVEDDDGNVRRESCDCKVCRRHAI